MGISPQDIAIGAAAGYAGSEIQGHIKHAMDPDAGSKFDHNHPIWLMLLDMARRMVTLEEAAQKFLNNQNALTEPLMIPAMVSSRQVFKLNRLGRKHAAIMVATTATNVIISIDGMGAMETITLNASQWNALDIPDGSELSVPSGTGDIPALVWLGSDLPAGLG